jgi:hypothetical protein
MSKGVGRLTPTIIVILVISFALIGYDIYLYANDLTTISEDVYTLSNISIGVPFLIGIVIGHWFW